MLGPFLEWLNEDYGEEGYGEEEEEAAEETKQAEEPKVST